MSKPIKTINSKTISQKPSSLKISSKPGPSQTRYVPLATTKHKSKEEDKKTTAIITKINPNKVPQQNSIIKNNVGSTHTKNSETIKVGTVRQQNVTTTRAEKQKSQPLRAQHAPEIVNHVNRLKTNLTAKTNPIMNTIHNVTVSSPPPRRKLQVEKPVENIKDALQRAGGNEKISSETKAEQQRERPRTRTLNPDEIIVLKGDLNDSNSVDKYFGSTVKKKQTADTSDNVNNLKLKNPVSFEINFPEKSTKLVNKQIEYPVADSDDYEDDFESYESDFETGSSSETEEIYSNSIKETDDDDDVNDIEDDDIIDEDSEETQPPITVIHREKESERKLDSGNYDLNSHKKVIPLTPTISQQQQLDSLDTSSTANSEQLDSGIGCVKNTDGNTVQIVYGGKIDFINSVNIASRGKDLMKKIQLDTVTYNLFDLKPINYEYFMKIYGNLNTMQSYTQTNENRLDSDTQTDNFLYRTMWTQHPPQYNLKDLNTNNNYQQNLTSCGECESDDDNDDINENEPLQKSVKALNRFRRKKLQKKYANGLKKQIDFDRLSEFLNKSSLTIAGILNKHNKNEKLIVSLEIGFSNGYINLNANFLNALRVVKIFSNLQYNLVLTIHESIDDIYNNDFLNLISVWNISEPENPIRLLSSWSEISRADICTESSEIIVCGLRDGSVAMWDLRETYSYCSKLDGYLTHFAATHSIVPSLGGEEIKLTDLGAVVDIKSFKKEAKAYNLKAYKQIQFVSINDTGILTIWTLVESGNDFATSLNKKNSNTKIEYQSPWARVKLIQSAICDLREYLELKNVRLNSPFEKTRSYFENDLFSDDALRELQESQKDTKLGLQGLRFINLDTSSDIIYIATNRNFIISCSKTLKSERFRKIYIDESKFLFPTALRLHTTTEFLLIGLSNGSVMALNCNRNKSKILNNDIDDEDHLSQLDNSEENDVELLVGKSCTIQNIIRNERKPNEYEGSSYYDTRPRTAISEFYDEPVNQYDYRIFDQQIILSGSVLRKNLVENIEISKDGKKLYALADGNIRVYDFLLESELQGSNDIKIKGICMINGNIEQQNFVSLTKDSEVQVHCTKE